MPPEIPNRATGAITPLTAADFARFKADGVAGFLASLAAQHERAVRLFRDRIPTARPFRK